MSDEQADRDRLEIQKLDTSIADATLRAVALGIRRRHDYSGDPCPSCGDIMTADVTNLRPTWSDRHDNIVCLDCAEARHLSRQTIILEITLDVDADIVSKFSGIPGTSLRNEVDPPIPPALNLGYDLGSALVRYAEPALRDIMRTPAKYASLDPVITVIGRLGVKFETDPAL